MIRIALADDHQLVLDGLKSLIQAVDGFSCVAEANDGKRLLDIIDSIQIDIALVDIDMPIMNGLQAIQEIKKRKPDVKCIALTMHNEMGMIKKVMQAGARAYILKNIDQEVLIEVIEKVHAGEIIPCQEYHETPGRHVNGSNPKFQNTTLNSPLSEREVEVLSMIAQGLSNKEIGEALFISHRTVDTHRTNMMKKLEVHNIAGLIRYALRSGYVD
ncbi:MAG: response regulator transcription factor [Salibacteraceae bacterium]